MSRLALFLVRFLCVVFLWGIASRVYAAPTRAKLLEVAKTIRTTDDEATLRVKTTTLGKPTSKTEGSTNGVSWDIRGGAMRKGCTLSIEYSNPTCLGCDQRTSVLLTCYKGTDSWGERQYETVYEIAPRR